ncbi:outer membrane lipoprotein carrier protein LolA [Planctomycetota bacterium]
MLEETKNQPTAAPQPNIQRIIMQNKLTKYAAAAVIIIMVITGLYMFDGSIGMTSIAWADVIKQIESVKTMSFVAREETIATEPSKNLPEDLKITRIYIKDPGMYRYEYLRVNDAESNEIFKGPASSETIDVVYILKRSGKQIIFLSYQPGIHSVFREVRNYVGSGPGFDDREALRLWNNIKSATADDTQQKGTENIVGIETVVFETSLEKINLRPWQGRAKIWIDSKTARPVRVQAQFVDDLGVSKKLTYSDIQWDIDLPDSLFNAPPGWQVQESQKDLSTLLFTRTKLREGVKVTMGPKDGHAIMTEADIESVIQGELIVTYGLGGESSRLIQLTVVPTEPCQERIKSYTSAHVKETILIDFDGFQSEPTIMSPLSGEVVTINIPSTDMTLKEFEEKYLR